MTEGNLSQEYRLKNINETNYLTEEIIEMNWWVKSTKRFVQNSFLFFTIFGCSISAFSSLVAIPVGITSSAIGLKICTITARIKKYNSVIKKKKKIILK